MPYTCDKADDFLQNAKDDLKFNVGDWVVLQREKGTFEHGFTVCWTREPFQIYQKCFKHGRLVFHIKDGTGEHVEDIQEDIVHFLDLIKEGGSVTTNTTALQRMEDKQSRTCGFHCVLFLIMREYKQIGADQIYTVHPQEGQEIHQNDVYATTFYEALLNKNI